MVSITLLNKLTLNNNIYSAKHLLMKKYQSVTFKIKSEMKRESRDVWINELMLSDINSKILLQILSYFIFMYLLLFIISVYLLFSTLQTISNDK